MEQPQPSTGDPQQAKARLKRKTLSSSSSSSSNSNFNTKPHLTQKRLKFQSKEFDAAATWALTREWPSNYAEKEAKISSVCKKCKSETTHRSDRLYLMRAHGIFTDPPELLNQESKELCNELLEGDREPLAYPVFPVEQVGKVLSEDYYENEATIQRDVLPWVVPSAVNLRRLGQPNMGFIKEELSAQWSRCEPMGGTMPKPDYAAGLHREIFSQNEYEALQRYAVPRPFLLSAGICFPFLICEAKCEEEGLNKAQRQNLHSASISIRAILELFRAAYGKDASQVTKLYGQPLIFTVSHNHDDVKIHGHLAILAKDGSSEIHYRRHAIAGYSLTLYDGKDRVKPYNFVRNVYDRFAPLHRDRIKDAAKQLQENRMEESLSESVDAASISLKYTGSPSRQDTDETVSSSESYLRVLAQPIGIPQSSKVIPQPSDELLQQMGRQMEAQMEKQMKQQLEQQRQQLEKQMEAQMEKQMEQQRQQIEKQMEQQRQQMMNKPME